MDVVKVVRGVEIGVEVFVTHAAADGLGNPSTVFL